MNLLIIKYLIYVLFFEKTLAEINVNITIASTKGAAKVTFNGNDIKLVSEKEVNIFNITDNNLKKAIKKELGKAPDEVFLKDPTAYGYTFYKYKWKEIHRNLQVKSIEIKDIVNEKIVLIARDYINNTTIKAKMRVNLGESIETIISSFWNKDGIHDSFYYNININDLKTNFSFSNKWMDNNFNYFKSIIGTNKISFINIAPGKTITATLTAKRTILLVKVVYAASLIGNLVANYARLYGKYHFWAPTISSIMKAGNLTNEMIINEIIEIKSYTDPVIDVLDKTTGNKVPILFFNKPFRYRKPKH